MKKLSILFNLIFAGALLLGLYTQPAAATSGHSSGTAQSDPEPGQAYLLVLPMPDPRSLVLPDRLSRSEAQQAAMAWARQQADKVSAELDALKAEGQISSYTFDAQELALRVETADGTNPEFSALQGSGSISTVLDAASPAVCSSGYSQALAELFFQISNLQAVQQIAAPSYTAPTIYAYAPVGANWSYVYGYSAGATTLTLKILRGGSLLHTETTTAEPDSTYEFSPTWRGGCQGSSYSWILRAGDVVQVSSNGLTSSTVIVPLTGWIDPSTDQLTGTTSPYHTTRLSVWADRPEDRCNTDYYDIYTVSGSDGKFMGDFTPLVDVDASASGLVFVFDSDYNATYAWVNPFSLFVDPDDGSVSGSLLPNQLVNVQRIRGAVSESYQVGSGPDGYVYADFFADFLPGDQVSLNWGSTAASYTVVDFDVSADAASNLVSGSTAASRQVKITSSNHAFSSGSPAPLYTACGALNACGTLRSASDGSFNWANPFDLQRGDSLSLRIYDAAGNGQDHTYFLPVIAADPLADRVLGYWELPLADLQVTVADSGGGVKQSAPVQSLFDHSYELELAVDLAAGDQVTVTDGALVVNMTVQAVSAHLNSSNETLSGSASAGFRLLDFADYDPLTGGTTHVCSGNPSFPGGNYSETLSTAGIEAADEAWVAIRSGDHFTLAYSHALQGKARLDDGTLTGFSPVPGAAVTATLLNGSTEVEVINVTAGDDGAFDAAFSVGTISSGQRIRVASAGETNEIVVPVMAIQLDPAADTVYGQAQANRPAVVSLYQAIGCGGACTRSLEITDLADAAGNYAVSYKGWRWQDCSPADVEGTCTYAGVETVLADEHSLSLFSPPPMPVWPDVYEDDNSVADAYLYNGLSRHTFHVQLDVDWVAFTVSALEVGRELSIDTTNLGPLSDTKMILYDTDGGTILMYSDDGPFGVGSQILFTPDAPGTYYVKILPYSKPDNTGNCGATYTFLITRYRTYLPLTRR